MSLARRLLLLLVNLDQPLVVAILVLALVAPLGHPLAAGIVVDHLALALLVLDTLLGGKALPFGRLLGFGNGLLAGKRRRGCRKDKVHAFRGRFDLTGGQELVDESLRGIAGCGAKGLFTRVGGDGVGVVGEEIAKVEGKGRWLVDGNGSAGGQLLVNRGRCWVDETYSLLLTVESATEWAAFMSIAPPLILSARCECVGDAGCSAMPPSISVSDILGECRVSRWSQRRLRKLDGETSA